MKEQLYYPIEAIHTETAQPLYVMMQDLHFQVKEAFKPTALTGGLVEGTVMQHYKGGSYVVYGDALTAEGEAFVFYRDTEYKYWLRPQAMFYEQVEVHGKVVPRFRAVTK